ncbi:SET domain-containing protein [Aphelenchoides bicaudatus]|nr:SET domain-containing protein [Aphelenchoides bicaudatus]
MDQKKLDQFAEWCRQGGVEFSAVEPVYYGPDRGCGLRAKRSIRWNEKFLKVPKSKIITAGLVADIPKYTNILKQHRLEPFPILVLFFYTESQDPESEFSPYLRILPKEFTTPLANDVQRSDQIPVEHLPNRVRDFLDKQRKEFEQIREEISKVLDPIKPDLELLNWAWHVVNTRCIFVENEEHPLVYSEESGDSIAVIPMVDLMNHSPNAQAVAYYDKITKSYLLSAEYSCVSEDAELFVCYGPHDNPRLWIEYGFCLPGNIFNRVDLPTSVFLAIAKKLCGNLDSGKREQLIKEAAFPCTIYASDISPPHGLKKNCQILIMNNKELSQAKKIIYNDNEDLEENDEVMDLTYKVLNELSHLLRRRADACPSGYRHFWTEQIEILDALICLKDSDE